MYKILGHKKTISAEERTQISNQVASEITLFLTKIREADSDAIIVTNELGFSVLPLNEFEIVFRDTLSKVNNMLGKECDELYLSICGTQLKIL